MRNTFSILFYLKRNSPLRSGMAPIMARITINGQRAQLSTHLSVEPSLGDTPKGRVLGHTQYATQTNVRLEKLRFHLTACYERLFFKTPCVTPAMVKTEFLGQDNAKRNLLTFFAHHNAHFFHMVGVSRSIHTYNKYRSVHKHLRQYIRERYGRPDIGFSEITPEFVTGFHAFLSQQARCSANTIWIYLIAFKHILKLACSEGLLRRNPLGDYKLHSEFVSRNFLTLDELNRILALDLHDRTMQLVRDGFIFSCFTGLSYSDLCNLTRRHVEQTGDQWWIRTKRCKTGTPVTVRLFELPAAILRNHALGREDDPIFTLPSNGWCNACLDKIAARAGIPKKITFHVARHTFATTITLSQGVTIETISKLLGHKNIRTTQIYATITHAKLSGELEQLSRRIDTLFDRTNMQSRGGL